MHLLAARELGVGPEECLAIEDSPAGVEAALAAGAEIVAVTTELTRQKFRDTGLLDRTATSWTTRVRCPRWCASLSARTASPRMAE
jgi:beta-phosphoglucomutase-like phosphatase (HAD superfamily)